MDPLWSPPTGTDPKLGPLDRISCGETLADHGGARITSDWLPFAHGLRTPLPEPGLQPPPDVNGFSWQTDSLQQVGRWQLSTIVGRYSFRHSTRVTSVAFTPDGRVAISGSADRTARLWDVGTGREIRALVGHDLLVTSVAISPNGRYAMTGSRDDTARLWELATGREVTVFEGHSGSVLLVAFSPGGELALTGSDDGTARLWDLRAGEEITVLAGRTYDPVYAVAFSPDGRLALTGSADGTIHLWNLASGAEVRALAGDQTSVQSVAFSPDGRCWVRGLGDGRVRMSEVATARELHCFADGSSPVTAVAVSPGGRMLASGSRDAVRVRKSTGEDVAAFTDLDAQVTCLAFSPDRRLVMAGLADGDIHLWDLETGSDARPPDRLAGDVRSLALSRRSVVALAPSMGDWYRDDRLWVVPTDPTEPTESVPAPVLDAGTLAVSPDGRYALVGGDEAARLWDLERHTPGPLLPNHDGFVTMAALGHGMAITGTSEGDVIRWDISGDIATRNLVLARTGDEITVGSLSPDGRDWVVASGTDLWGGKTDGGACTTPALTMDAPITALAWSSDGSTIVVATSDRQVHLLNRRLALQGVIGAARQRVLALSPVPPSLAEQVDGATPVGWLALTPEGFEPLGDTPVEQARMAEFRPVELSTHDAIASGVIGANGTDTTLAVGVERGIILVYKWI